GSLTLTSDYVLIACGSRPARSSQIPIDGRRTVDSDQLGQIERIPRDVIIVGAGVIGLEYASMLTTLGGRVTVIDQRPTLLDFVDREIIESLIYHMRGRGATFRLGEKVVSVEVDPQDRVVTVLESGKKVHGDGLLYTVGRQANTDILSLEAAGLAADSRGRI